MSDRLDKAVTSRGLATSRSQAESWIRLGKVTVNGKVVTKAGFFVADTADIKLTADEQYVSRAGLKLASVATLLGLDFRGKTVLDVGSSTGGFTDYALQHGAEKVYAVDVGTDQLHPSLQGNERIELHEKTDIRDFKLGERVTRGGTAPLPTPLPSFDAKASSRRSLDTGPDDASAPSSQASRLARRGTPRVATRATVFPDIIVIDVSFISLREILPHIAEELAGPKTQVVAMVKPQFEAGRDQTNKGVIKNDAVRRKILGDFETWVKHRFVIQDKRDSEVAGAKGNRERFYLLQKLG